MKIVKINRYKDFIERVGWTFLQAEIGLGLLDWLTKGINLSLLHTVYLSLGAAAAATIKVLIAQNVGKHPDGAAIPGGVIKDERGQVQAALLVVLILVLLACVLGVTVSGWFFLLLFAVLFLVLFR